MGNKTMLEMTGALRLGLIAGIVIVYLCLVGMIVAFNERFIIGDVLTLGQFLLFLPPFGIGYYVANRTSRDHLWRRILHGTVAGAISGIVVIVFILLGTNVDLRVMFLNASPELFEILSFGRESLLNVALIWILLGSGLGLVGTLLELLPNWIGRAILTGIAAVVLIGLMQELLRITFGTRDWYKPIDDLLFERKGLSIAGAVIVFVLAAGISLIRHFFGHVPQQRIQQMPARGQRTFRSGMILIGVIILLLLPPFLGTYPSEVLTNVGIFVLMGLGLNIVVGFAGLLDLGYVAFFAIGAYTVGVFTTSGSLATLEWNFWQALPFAILFATLAGVILGIPVLKMRGDYLAIVTLGFGEIIRILVLSDALRPWLGGAQGILQIPKAQIGDFVFKGPQQIFYMVLAGIAIVAFVAWRLRDARLGRAWKAMREDEDVAEAMGIHLVTTKLLAFATGAAFAGLAGAIFAVKLGSVFPHSFNLLISINVLSIIIVGGIGSLPGVVVGALILVGLPELLREFADYRMLMYGALLVIMMLVRPEGFIPEKTHRMELHGDDETGKPVGNLTEAGVS